jgi:hypothetical protein
MYNLPNKAKSSLLELPRRRKKKLKNNNYKKTTVGIDEWTYLEWPCVDSLASKISE